ncbi:MAG: hypothetical protein R3C05_21405 [Pirellulaceae bacterium]
MRRRKAGAAAFSAAPRLVFAAADLDQSGTIDLALVNSESNSTGILRNRLIGGANRLNLSGTETIPDQNFGIRSSILHPSVASIDAPSHVLEDAGAITVEVSGIERGYSSGPPLRITAVSSDSSSVTIDSSVNQSASDDSTARIVLVPVSDAVGSATVRVRIQTREPTAYLTMPTMGWWRTPSISRLRASMTRLRSRWVGIKL